MPNCRYCGQSAGLFSRAHRECEASHSNGLATLPTLIADYFSGLIPAKDLAPKLATLKTDAYLSRDEIAQIAQQEIRNFTQSLQAPYHPSSMRLVSDLLSMLAAQGVAHETVNSDGVVYEFASLLIRSYIKDYCEDRLELPRVEARCQKVLRYLPVAQERLADIYLSPLDQATILKSLQRGALPPSTIMAPIILAKGEQVVWAYEGVALYQEKIVREWVGRSQGISVRVMRGVYYRTGGMRGRPVERSTMECRGVGTLYVTNRNLIFYSPGGAVKVPFKKIIALTPYTDGVEVHRDGANQRRLTMQGFDPWFLLNLLSSLS